MSRYVEADADTLSLAAELVADYHPHLQSLRVEVVFDGREGHEAGHARKISGLNAFLSAPKMMRQTGSADTEFFAIVLCRPVWEVLTPEQRRATMDHFLSACRVVEDERTGAVTLAVEKPEFGEFPEVIARHGLNWRPDLRAFFQGVHASGQLELLDLGQPRG